MAATETRAATRPYSIIVAPASSFRKAYNMTGLTPLRKIRICENKNTTSHWLGYPVTAVPTRWSSQYPDPYFVGLFCLLPGETRGAAILALSIRS